jgi:Fe-S cluster biogenesis protein NfuA
MSNSKIDINEQVKQVIEKEIRPFIEADGGKIELKNIDNGIVYVQLAGACAGCPGAIMTLKGGVESILKNKFAEIKEVKLAY